MRKKLCEESVDSRLFLFADYFLQISDGTDQNDYDGARETKIKKGHQYPGDDVDEGIHCYRLYLQRKIAVLG